MILPGLVGYGETMAEFYVNYKIRCREDREAEAIRTAPGPVYTYVPYGGRYRMYNEAGSFMGYYDRDEAGEWVQVGKPEPLIVL